MSNEEIKLPELPQTTYRLWVVGDEYESGWMCDVDGFNEEAMQAFARAAILADRAARPVADAGEAVATVVSSAGSDLRIGWLRPELCSVGDQLYRAAPSARTLSDAEINNIADDFKGEYEHGGTTFETFDSLGFARALLAASAPAEAPSVRYTCPHCGTHEVSLARLCHNSACSSYATEETIYEGWLARQGKPEAPSDGEIYGEVSRRADPDGHAASMAEMERVLGKRDPYANARNGAYGEECVSQFDSQKGPDHG